MHHSCVVVTPFHRSAWIQGIHEWLAPPTEETDRGRASPARLPGRTRDWDGRRPSWDPDSRFFLLLLSIINHQPSTIINHC